MKTVDILLIEDDAIDHRLVLETFARVPDNKNYNVEWQKSYEDGLNAIREKSHDIYLVDYTINRKNGLELVREARSLGFDGPYILLMGMDSQDVYDESADLGVYDYILKGEMSPSSLDRSITYALERSSVEQRLIAQKAFNELIMHQLPYMVVVIRKGGGISFVNPVTYEITGYAEEEILGQQWQFLFPVNDEELLSEKIVECFESGKGFLAPFIDKNGEEKTINWNIIRHSENADEEEIEFILSGKDITDEIEIEAQARQKGKMEALGHLASGVAHELNNLLQPIILAADIVQGQFEPEEKSYEHMGKVIRSASAAASIVEDILSFSRQEKKAQELIDLSCVLEGTMKLVADMLPEGIHVNITGQDKLKGSRVLINKSDMVRLMTNITMNAAQAMDQDGQVSIHQDLVDVNSKSNMPDLDDGIYAKIDIIDSGAGISPENLDIIFNPFFTTKDVGEGTGLGLPICFNILQSWGGTITVKSKFRHGSVFSLYIPVADVS